MNILWKEKCIWFRVLENGQEFCEARKRIGHKDICPLCTEKVDSGSVVLVVSNQAGIPNRILHFGCFSKDSPEKTMDSLAERYEEAKAYKKKYAHWFE